jgi:hypothetical protein
MLRRPDFAARTDGDPFQREDSARDCSAELKNDLKAHCFPLAHRMVRRWKLRPIRLRSTEIIAEDHFTLRARSASIHATWKTLRLASLLTPDRFGSAANWTDAEKWLIWILKESHSKRSRILR